MFVVNMELVKAGDLGRQAPRPYIPEWDGDEPVILTGGSMPFL